MYNLKLRSEKNRMILDHIKLAKTLSRRFTNLPYEDRFQEACLGLMKASQNYEPDKEVSFGAYAKVVIINQLKQYYKKEKMRFLLIIQDNQFEDDKNEYRDPMSISDYNYIELMEDLKKHFGDFKIKILIEIVNGKTQEDCSQIFGISQPSVSRIIKQMREAIKEGLI